MPRAARVQIPGGHFHVIARAVSGAPLFQDDNDRLAFLKSLEDAGRRRGWGIWAYCLMTTHYHLVVETPNADLARGIQFVNSRYAQGYNRRWDRYGHVFAERYSSRLVETERYLGQACTYVLENPVRAGLCDSPEKWPWSGGRVFEDMAEGLTLGRRAS